MLRKFVLRLESATKTILLIGSVLAILIGFIIVISSLDNLYAAYFELSVMGGLKFIGGAILTGFGLLSLAVYYRKAGGTKHKGEESHN